MHASARALAKLAAYMANKGTFKGKQLLSEEAWNKMHAEPTFSAHFLQNHRSFFTKGGVCIFDFE